MKIFNRLFNPLTFNRVFNFCLIVIVLTSLAMTTVRCTNDDEEDPVVEPTVKLTTSATLGKHLTDSLGRTLYFFTRDVAGTNTCTGGCASLWPVFYKPNLTQDALAEGLNITDFGTITTSDGRQQTTYKGWPIYYYAPVTNGVNTQELAGETKGENVGGVWFVAKPDYTLMLANLSILNKNTQQTTAERFLVDEKGLTLYIFAKDQKNPATLPSNCTGGCINVWPVYYRENMVIPSALNKSDFGAITRNDGANGTTRQHATYKGNPLYYFAQDNSTRGKAEGHGFTGAGDLWFVVNP